MSDLEKKVATIQRKCNKFGCDFHFAKVGEEIKEVTDYTREDPETGKALVVKCRFIICEVEGVAKVNGWQFVASVEHTDAGNIFSKALTDVEIPERYRFSDTYCEHCNSHRRRKGTFIVMNTETGEFKQVGHNCLLDFTHGMSASWAAYMASLRAVFAEAEERPVGGCYGWRDRFFNTEEFLHFAAETIRHFGYSKTSDETSTKSRVMDFFNVAHGNTAYWDKKDIINIQSQMDRVGFDADSKEAKEMTDKALAWLSEQNRDNDYMHNLKVVASLPNINSSHFGLLISLFPTWNRELEIEDRRRAEAEKGKASVFVGEIGKKIEVEAQAVKCVCSWESSWNGYTTDTTYIWKITGKDGNIYTWKTSKHIDVDFPPIKIKGSVKDHTEYRGVKQTELTRCKMEFPKYEGPTLESFGMLDEAI